MSELSVGGAPFNTASFGTPSILPSADENDYLNLGHLGVDFNNHFGGKNKTIDGKNIEVLIPKQPDSFNIGSNSCPFTFNPHFTQNTVELGQQAKNIGGSSSVSGSPFSFLPNYNASPSSSSTPSLFSSNPFNSNPFNSSSSSSFDLDRSSVPSLFSYSASPSSSSSSIPFSSLPNYSSNPSSSSTPSLFSSNPFNSNPFNSNSSSPFDLDRSSVPSLFSYSASPSRGLPSNPPENKFVDSSVKEFSALEEVGQKLTTASNLNQPQSFSCGQPNAMQANSSQPHTPVNPEPNPNLAQSTRYGLLVKLALGLTISSVLVGGIYLGLDRLGRLSSWLRK